MPRLSNYKMVRPARNRSVAVSFQHQAEVIHLDFYNDEWNHTDYEPQVAMTMTMFWTSLSSLLLLPPSSCLIISSCSFWRDLFRSFASRFLASVCCTLSIKHCLPSLAVHVKSSSLSIVFSKEIRACLWLFWIRERTRRQFCRLGEPEHWVSILVGTEVKSKTL